MEQRKKKKNKGRISNESICWILLSAAFAVNCFCVIFATSPQTFASSLGVVLMLALSYAAFGYYLYTHQTDVFLNVKNMTVIAMLIILVMLLSLLTTLADIHMTPALLACLLASLLISDNAALLLNLLLSLSAGLMCRGEGSMMGFDGFMMTIASVLGGTAAVFMLKNKAKRSNVIGASAFGGIVIIVVMAAAYLLAGIEFKAALPSMGWAFASAVICSFLAVGSLAVWEGVFDAATPARLNELSSANHPLLKQLMAEAPGTYHHSMMVAMLAEAAAQRIGADHVLARVGAYYHDVGKLRRPQYFVENQSGANIHDTLSPSESASIIISHQKDSVQLLTKYKLPGAVIKIASEHHGNSLMAYFYNKAVGSAGSPSAVNKKQYRYPSSKPSTKESAIVMMADCCEAAVRSLGDTTKEQVEKMVKSVISSKLNGPDPQLKNAPLTIAEVDEIEKAFIKTFTAIMHERIQYPKGN